MGNRIIQQIEFSLYNVTVTIRMPDEDPGNPKKHPGKRGGSYGKE